MDDSYNAGRKRLATSEPDDSEQPANKVLRLSPEYTGASQLAVNADGQIVLPNAIPNGENEKSHEV